MPLARVGLWLLTLTALALLVKAWWSEAVPGVWLFAVWLALVIGVVWGLAFPRVEMFADLVWRAPPGEASSVLSFDGLPEPQQLEEILGELARHGVPATFFVAASALDPARASALARAGHHLALALTAGSERSVSSLARRFSEDTAALTRAAGQPVVVLRALRPARRLLTPALAEAARRAQLTLVGGGLGWPPPSTIDWERWGARIGPRQLVCVPGSLLGAPPAQLTRLLEAAAQRGVRWVSLAEWLS